MNQKDTPNQQIHINGENKNIMTFEQLDYFIAVVQSDTFFDAAEALHITQSTLSKQIIKLEKELNITLLDRSHRLASLTKAGELFYEEALLLSRQYHQTLQRMRRFRDEESSSLRIGTLPILSQYHLTASLKEFADTHPSVRLTLTEVEELELMHGFAENEFDLIICRNHMLDLETTCFHTLAEDSLAAILPPDHPLSKRDFLSLHELAGEQFILMPSYTSIHQLCIEWFKKCNITPDILRTARVESILDAVAVHEGIGLCARGNFELFRNDHVRAVLLSPSPELSIGIAVKNPGLLSPAAAEFIHFMQKKRR